MKNFEIEYLCTAKTKCTISAESEDDARKIFKKLAGRQDRVFVEGKPVNNRIMTVTEKEDEYVL